MLPERTYISVKNHNKYLIYLKFIIIRTVNSFFGVSININTQVKIDVDYNTLILTAEIFWMVLRLFEGNFHKIHLVLRFTDNIILSASRN